MEDRDECRKRKALEKRTEKKKRMKAMFDSMYDDKEGGGTYFDDLKSEMEQQAIVSGRRLGGIVFCTLSHGSIEGIAICILSHGFIEGITVCTQ